MDSETLEQTSPEDLTESLEDLSERVDDISEELRSITLAKDIAMGIVSNILIIFALRLTVPLLLRS